jgi:hypothetical protein
MYTLLSRQVEINEIKFTLISQDFTLLNDVQNRDWNHYIYTVMIASAPPKVIIVAVYRFLSRK